MNLRRRHEPPVQYAPQQTSWLQQARHHATAAIEATLGGTATADGEPLPPAAKQGTA